MPPVPFDILEGMIQCFGKCFYYKDPMAAFFASAGVPSSLIDKYRQEFKYLWARHVLTDLGKTEEGCLIQRRVLTSLCNLRNLPDEKVSDRDAGLDALRALKHLAVERELVVRKKRESEKERARIEEQRAKIIQERKTKLLSLCATFTEAVTAVDRQKAGYSLEDLLHDLFGLFEIEYRKPYRTSTQQIDGYFRLGGFDYLVEAKWRKDRPTEQEIGGFRQKVDSKLESTRGLFVSIPGFRQEVIEQFSNRGANIILMDGAHLIHILEGRIDLRDALTLMIQKAAQEGMAYVTLGLR